MYILNKQWIQDTVLYGSTDEKLCLEGSLENDLDLVVSQVARLLWHQAPSRWILTMCDKGQHCHFYDSNTATFTSPTLPLSLFRNCHFYVLNFDFLKITVPIITTQFSHFQMMRHPGSKRSQWQWTSDDRRNREHGADDYNLQLQHDNCGFYTPFPSANLRRKSLTKKMGVDSHPRN